MDSIRRFFSWSVLLLALSFSTAFGLMYSVAFCVAPKQPVDYKVFVLSLSAFVGFYLVLNRWLSRVQPRAIRIQENPADLNAPAFLQEMWELICGSNPLISIGSLLLAGLATICVCAFSILIGYEPHSSLLLALPCLYLTFRLLFHEPKKGGGHNNGR